ncbi:MAG TPA: ATP-binding protein, partial [Solirubrobacteraceae bacterium]|nr:ATP-binding protein [Solirubrobacteraceae bacterium]
PPEAVERLTQPFERLDRARESRGTGLGLSIVRAVAEAHGARLGIAARPGGGLRVRVAFG